MLNFSHITCGVVRSVHMRERFSLEGRKERRLRATRLVIRDTPRAENNVKTILYRWTCHTCWLRSWNRVLFYPIVIQYPLPPREMFLQNVYTTGFVRVKIILSYLSLTLHDESAVLCEPLVYDSVFSSPYYIYNLHTRVCITYICMCRHAV